MLAFFVDGYNALKEMWGRLGTLWRIVFVIAGLIGLYFTASWVPSVTVIKEWYGRAGAETQLMFLVVGLVVLLALTISAVDGWHRVNQLKVEKTTAEEKRAEAEEKQVAAEVEATRLQTQWDNLLAVGCKDVLWRRPPGIIPPAFVPKSNRKTRFLTVLNLKGGVGKTTISANLAAGLANGDKALRVLVVDIDFQGTLSRAAVDKAIFGVQAANGNFVNLLLTTRENDPGLLRKLAVEMVGVKTNRVILADEDLDHTEFELQARFFVDNSFDPRFRFRQHLHQLQVFEDYDLVLFDCPPRITTSVVNAVACSDYVLIPTKLDTGSVEAIPRTLSWMKSLGEICPAEVLGVIASHVRIVSGKPIKDDKDSYEYLRKVIQYDGASGKLLFREVVASTNKAVNGTAELASGTEDGRKVFAPIVKELRERMGL